MQVDELMEAHNVFHETRFLSICTWALSLHTDGRYSPDHEVLNVRQDKHGLHM